MAANPINNILGLFGFEIKSKEDPEKEAEKAPSFSVPQSDDGAITVVTGSHYGTYLDFNEVARNEIELITKYREMAMQTPLDDAISQIVNEAVVTVDEEKSVSINLDDVEQPSSIKKKIQTEFDEVLKLLDFQKQGQDWFRRWYIDGRINFHVIINETQPKLGIQELRYIDPRRLRKIREIEKEKDSKTGIDIIKSIKDYYLYNEFGQITSNNPVVTTVGARIAPDAIVSAFSGLMDPRRVMVLSYLNKAIKPLNMLTMVEDMVVIYRMVTSPERRIFYVDVGNMPTIKANQYLKEFANDYRNKLTYDGTTGEIRDDRKFMSAIEDIWIPRREGSQATSVDRLEGGQNLGNIEDVEYFQKKLYKALGIPISRIDPQDSFIAGFGRSTEVSREEINFNKFIEHLRNRFSNLFNETLRVQLILKGICTEEEWKEIKENIRYDFMKDNNFEELKEAEILMNRVQVLTMMQPFIGTFYSQDWIKKNVLHQTEEEIEEMQDQMDTEKVSQDLDNQQFGGDPNQQGGPQQQGGGGMGYSGNGFGGFGGGPQQPSQPFGQ